MSVPRRTPGWRGRLVAYVGGVRGAPFRPGRLDCALFCAGAIEAMAGVDLARGLRGYRTLAEGRRRLAAAGYPGVGELVGAHLPAIPPALAGVGDVVELREGEELVTAIVQGPLLWAVTADGLGLLPRDRALRAWRLP
jgi:hypothetical protein